jgi:hypothetical protein
MSKLMIEDLSFKYFSSTPVDSVPKVDLEIAIG